jgi:hypothetical protein
MTQPDPEVLAVAERMAVRFTEIAWMLGGGQPQEWTAKILHRYSVLIGRSRKHNRDDEEDERKAIKAAEELEGVLRLYGMVEDEFGFQNPYCVGAVLSDLPDVIEFLKDQLLPPTAGGPIPDDRRRLCAAVCTAVWRRHRGKVQPFNTNLWKACEEYWQACGQPETSKQSNLNTWQRSCEWAAKLDEDEDWNADFDWQIQYVTRPK